MSDPIEVLRERLRDYAEGLAAPVTLHAEDVAELTALIRAALASLSAPKQYTGAIDAAMRDALQHGTGALRVEHIPHGELSAPKPESAEAVAWFERTEKINGFMKFDTGLADGVEPETFPVGRTKLYTAPPRPEASAPFGECGCGKPVDYFDVMGRPSCNKRIRCSEQQASAPVGVEGWSVAPVEDDPDMLAVETPDGRTWFAKRGDRVFELAEALALAQQPAPVAPVGVEQIIATDEAGWALAKRAEVAGAERDSDDHGTWWTLRIEQFKALAQQPAAEPTDEAVAEFRRFLNGKQPVDDKITMKQARHILREWPAQQPAAIPRLANCGRYTATDNTGQHYYLNHENTWQTFQGQQPAADDDAMRKVAAIAHSGGLLNMSEADALIAIRRLSLPFWAKEEKPEQVRSTLAGQQQGGRDDG